MQTDLFFSRRIGLSDTGQPMPILGGARLTGKAGKNNIAMLDIQTDSAFGKPGDNFFVSRYSRDVLRRSRVGAHLRQQGIGRRQRALQPHDGRRRELRLGSNFQVNSYVAKTSTPIARLAAWPARTWRSTGASRTATRAWNLWLNYLDVQDNFNAEAGFVQRRGIRTTKAYFSPTPRPKRGAIS